jgi:hypothetical protein
MGLSASDGGNGAGGGLRAAATAGDSRRRVGGPLIWIKVRPCSGANADTGLAAAKGGGRCRRYKTVREISMKIAMLFTGSGPLVIVTSHESLTDPVLLDKLRAKGIEKFIAYELQPDLVKERYAGHFDVVMKDLHESDDLRVLDFNGERAFRLFHLKELGPPTMFEGGARL